MSLQRGIRPGAPARYPVSTGHLPQPARPWPNLPAPTAGAVLFLLLAAPFPWLVDALPRAAADYASTLVFAFTGALVGLRRASPAFRVPLALVSGFLTANGGGTVRTLLLGHSDFFWMTDPGYLLLTVAGAALAETRRRLLAGDWFDDTAGLLREAYAPVLRDLLAQAGDTLYMDRADRAFQALLACPMSDPARKTLEADRRDPRRLAGRDPQPLVEAILAGLCDPAALPREPLQHLAAFVRGFGRSRLAV